MECQGLMFHSFLYVILYVKIINYAEFLPVFLDENLKIRYIIVSFLLYSIHFLYTIEEIKKQDFQKKEI